MPGPIRRWVRESTEEGESVELCCCGKAVGCLARLEHWELRERDAESISLCTKSLATGFTCYSEVSKYSS